MKVIIIGSKNWDNYNEVMRNMTILIDDWVKSDPEDKTLTILHSGSIGAENMITEYIGKVERLFKQKGYSIKEKIYRTKHYTGEFPHIDRDQDMINSGVEKVMVFSKDSCKRTTSFSKLVQAYGIETKIIQH